MLMGLKLHGVPVSATEATPPASPTKVVSFPSSSTSTTGIRIKAPLTNDDSEFEYDSSNWSDYGLESDGSLSGEEDGSGGTVPQDDGKIREETHFVKEYVVSKPSLKIPVREINQRSSFEKIVPENVAGEGNNHIRPFSADGRKEVVGISMQEEESSNLVRFPGVASMNKPRIIAKLSRDTDDDDDGFESNGSLEEEDEPFIGVARVSISGDAGRFPKVKIPEVGGRDDNISFDDSGSEGGSIEESSLIAGVAEEVVSDSRFQEKQIADDLIAAEVVEDKGPFIAEESGSGESYDEIREFNMNTGENSVESHHNNEKDSETTDCSDEVIEVKEVTEAKVEENLEEGLLDYGTVSEPCVLDGVKNVESDQKLETFNTDASEFLEYMDGIIRGNETLFMDNVKFLYTQAVEKPGFLLNGHSVDVTSGESSECDLQATDSGNVLDAHSHCEEEEVCSSLFPVEPLRPSTGEKPVIINGETVGILTHGERMKLEKLQDAVVKFLRLVHRLHKSPEDSVVVKVLHQLLLAAGGPYTESLNLELAKERAAVLEAEGKNDFNFSLNVLVIGKGGVGKSATINSIFGEEKARIDAFEPGTTSVKEIKGTFDGIHIRVLDTPGLSSSLMDHSFNCKVLSSIKRFTKKLPPDAILYVNRFDTQIGDLNDLPLLKLVTSSLGSSIWSRAIMILTHAASIPAEGGPSGEPLSYDLFAAKVSEVFQQKVSHLIGKFGATEPSVLPVSLIENCSVSGMERNEQAFVYSKEDWRSQILLLCFSMKILSEIESIFKTTRATDNQKLFGFRVSKSLNADVQLANPSDFDQCCDGEDHLLSPFKPQEELDAENEYMEDNATKMDSPGAVLPDRVLPLAFDGEIPAHKYCSQESSSQFLAMPVMYLHSWDHDCGYDGSSMEDNVAVTGQFPVVIAAAQVTKDKNEFNFKLDSAETTAVELDTEAAGMLLVNILKMEARSRRVKADKIAAGVTITMKGEDFIAGSKVEDELALVKQLILVGTTGLIQNENGTAYGAMLGIGHGQGQTLLGLSLTRGWRTGLACGLNLHSQFSVSQNSKLSIRAGFMGREPSRAVSVRLRSSDQPLIATLAFLPIVRTICNSVFMLLNQRWREH